MKLSFHAVLKAYIFIPVYPTFAGQFSTLTYLCTSTVDRYTSAKVFLHKHTIVETHVC